MSKIRILGIDSSATPASAAVVEDGKILGEFFINTKLTHSQTLMPMVKSVLEITDTTSPDLIAVTSGPGSFTGVRIGIASAKGLAFTEKIPCVGVSALTALAYNFANNGANSVICAVMDARCGQVYNGLFQLKNGEITRLCPDRTIAVTALKEEVCRYGRSLVLVGDFAAKCHKTFQSFGAELASEQSRYQRASAVALAGIHEKWITAAQLQPVYLQLPQAQRELNKRMETKKN
ncbi:MAG: tRNA (adenosine(37)-N6)-threonylcarbamoyltransferase complex dimerization subunit type 1 TsaB [Oscillospiraceae bacterium]